MPWKYTHDKKTRPNLWLSVEMENFCSKTKSNLVTEEFYLMFQKSKPFDSLATLDLNSLPSERKHSSLCFGRSVRDKVVILLVL